MSEFLVSTRYANALLSISEDKNTFENVLNDVSLVKNTLSSSRELRNFLVSPIIDTSKKSNVLNEIFKSKIGEDVQKFLQFLIDKGRENILLDICERFLSLSNDKLNQVDVEITSAINLNDSQKENIKLKLEQMIGKTIISNYEIDPTIIGGFKARIKDTIVDASIQHQLELLKKKLFEKDFLKN